MLMSLGKVLKMRDFEIKPILKKKLDKLYKKDRILCEYIFKKIDEIINNPYIEHYKNLRYDFKKSKRVHIGSFVLVFCFDKEKDFIYFEDFNHHDQIYGS